MPGVQDRVIVVGLELAVAWAANTPYCSPGRVGRRGQRSRVPSRRTGGSAMADEVVAEIRDSSRVVANDSRHRVTAQRTSSLTNPAMPCTVW